jgi:hypothetical protein
MAEDEVPSELLSGQFPANNEEEREYGTLIRGSQELYHETNSITA